MDQKDFARRLRKSATDAERRLWRHLRARRTSGLRFHRQQPVGPYIVDFLCHSCRLVIEVDGGQHMECPSDRQRDRWLAAHGFVVLRFWNNEVLQQTQAVLERIAQCAQMPRP